MKLHDVLFKLRRWDRGKLTLPNERKKSALEGGGVRKTRQTKARPEGSSRYFHIYPIRPCRRAAPTNKMTPGGVCSNDLRAPGSAAEVPKEIGVPGILNAFG